MKINVKLEPDITQDSLEYEQLKEAVIKTIGVPGYICEIGLRGGGGTFYFLETLREINDQQRGVVAIDPYGNIPYISGDNEVIKQDYTNGMRDDTLLNLYVYVIQSGCANDFHFFNLEDTEFFQRYADGIPMYNETKFMMNQYSVVHLDGPHSTDALKAEIDFFHPRMPERSIMIFDDVELFGQDKIEAYLVNLGWRSINRGERKESFQKSG